MIFTLMYHLLFVKREYIYYRFFITRRCHGEQAKLIRYEEEEKEEEEWEEEKEVEDEGNAFYSALLLSFIFITLIPGLKNEIKRFYNRSYRGLENARE